MRVVTSRMVSSDSSDSSDFSRAAMLPTGIVCMTCSPDARSQQLSWSQPIGAQVAPRGFTDTIQSICEGVIRDRVSTEIEGLTFEQEQAWLVSPDISDPYLKRLRDRVIQQAAEAVGTARRG